MQITRNPSQTRSPDLVQVPLILSSCATFIEQMTTIFSWYGYYLLTIHFDLESTSCMTFIPPRVRPRCNNSASLLQHRYTAECAEVEEQQISYLDIESNHELY